MTAEINKGLREKLFFFFLAELLHINTPQREGPETFITILLEEKLSSMSLCQSGRNLRTSFTFSAEENMGNRTLRLWKVESSKWQEAEKKLEESLPDLPKLYHTEFHFLSGPG